MHIAHVGAQLINCSGTILKDVN